MNSIGIFVGLSTIDIIYTVAEQPARNQKITAHSQQIIVGGPAANAAFTFAFLGGTASLVTPAGRHYLSAMIKAECDQFNVGLEDLDPDSQQAPPISSIWVDPEGQRSIVSVNTRERVIPPAVVNPELFEGTHVLMVDGHAMQACQTWACAAKSHGVPVIFDGGSWKPGTDLLLKSVDVAICSADFLPPGCKDQQATCEYLHQSGVKSIAITHGSEPIQYSCGTGSGMIEVPQIDAVDTTGAGDVFHGAFCFNLATGSDFETALRQASIVASESCRYRGTREWMKAYRD